MLVTRGRERHRGEEEWAGWRAKPSKEPLHREAGMWLQPSLGMETREGRREQ